VFAVSRDEEHVTIHASYGRSSHELTRFQVPTHVLLDLARKQLADRAAGLPEDDCGWIEEEDVARQAGYTTLPLLKAKLFRLRFLFSYLPVTDPDNIVERHSSRSQLRIGATASSIRELRRCNCVCGNLAANPAYASCGDVLARQWRTPRARRASHFTVACHALLARLASPDSEVIGDLSTATEVHLVGCLAFERAVGDPLVGVTRRKAVQPSG
jgi:hypothetical protein